MCDLIRLKVAMEEIDEVLDRLDFVFIQKLCPVDQVLAAKLEVARSILEGLNNDIRDSYVGWDD